MQICAISDRGKRREQNEDFCIAKKTGAFTLLILADGMGGHNSGETASRLAVEVICSYIEAQISENMLPGQLMLLLSDAMEKANEKIITCSGSNPEFAGMGTTCDACIIAGNKAYIAHVGDSRVYKISRKGAISKLTKDHSLVEYMLETGAITPEEAVNHPRKNVITRALGEEGTSADISHETLSEGDIILLCSDGLSNMLSEEQIAAAVTKEKTPEKAAARLVKLANEAGGTDNISVVIAADESGIYGGK